jgi:hypothetical protein
MAAPQLFIGAGVSLPADAVTQTFAILAKRGVGKSYTASVLAEEMLKASQAIVALDPTGAWWGLRSGFPIVIFGGEHADVPLEESAGEVVARSIVENRFSAVIDLSLFRKGQMIRFMVAFAETLYRLNREPLHLFVDEADAVAPQARNYGGDENRMLGAMEDIVRRGRKRGIGCTLITQRPAVLNKNVLTQCEILVALRMVHPKDIEAIKEWVNVHADPATAKSMIEDLPALPIGTAWFWSPGWLGNLQKVAVRRRETFDSGATPKPGEAVRKPKSMAKIDLDALGDQIKATVEKAKADDPKELRRRITTLENDLKARPAETKVEVKETIREVPVLKNGQLDRTEKIIDRAEAVTKIMVEQITKLRDSVITATTPSAAGPIGRAGPAPTSRPVQPSRRPPIGGSSGHPRPRPQTAAPAEGLNRKQQQILDALAWWESIGVNEPTNAQLGAIALIDTSGGYFSNVAGPLSSTGLIERGMGTTRLTDAGRQVATVPQHTTSLAEYHDMMRERVRRHRSSNGKTIAILDVVIDAGGRDVTNAEIGDAAAIDTTGGYFSNSIGPLSTIGLIERRAGVVRPTELLFPPGL